MDMGFPFLCPLARHRMPQIQFLYISSHLCSALLSGPASRRVLFHACASLSLHVHHVVRGLTPPSCQTCSAHRKKGGFCSRPFLDFQQNYQENLTIDRKSTRLNSSHSQISYAVFCLKHKK